MIFQNVVFDENFEEEKMAFRHRYNDDLESTTKWMSLGKNRHRDSLPKGINAFSFRKP
jgi:hypothetical protein